MNKEKETLERHVRLVDDQLELTIKSISTNEVNKMLKKVQVGHRFNVQFKLPIVDDKVVYKDGSNKTKGYNVIDGVNHLETHELRISKGGRPKKKETEGC